ncbi:MAG: lipopolysaccharide biosynthesis protein [Hungatella sp.]|nr:lipopolysaccharide biosynthesis protein [Hungatella sp.]
MADKWVSLLLRTGGDKERENVIWNIIGSFCYAFASMVLSFLVLRIIGKEQGGIFSFGYSTFGQQMFLLAYFGIRPFHVTDGRGSYGFGDYLHHRYITCGMALAVGAAYLAFCGYGREKAAVIFLLVCYKVVDGLADVYESEFQRNGNLHLTGKSNTFRTLLSVGTFLVVLILWKDLMAACVAAVAAQAAGVILFDRMVIKRLSGIQWEWRRDRLLPLTWETILLFVSVFLDFYIFSASKYAIDACMDDVASGYFNLIFMPTSMINLAAGFVIRPVLTFLTDDWNQKRFSRFARLLLKISGVIAGLSTAAVVLAWILGKPMLGIMERLLGSAYTGSLTVYHSSFVVIVLGGGFYAFLNLYYYVLVIIRRQKVIFGIYFILTLLAAWLAPRLVAGYGIPGAAWAYVSLMVVMAAGFVAGAWILVLHCGNKGECSA